MSNVMSESASKLSNLLGERTRLQLMTESINEQLAKRISEIDLWSAACFFPGVQVYPVWGNEGLNVSLMVNKNHLGGCGILLWGVQLKDYRNHLTMKIQEFEAQFMVFNGKKGSNHFAILDEAGSRESESLFKHLRKVCSIEGVQYVFVKEAESLRTITEICPGREFREISEFYMMISRRDGSIIPEFNFIDPEKSLAFWHN